MFVIDFRLEVKGSFGKDQFYSQVVRCTKEEISSRLTQFLAERSAQIGSWGIAEGGIIATPWRAEPEHPERGRVRYAAYIAEEQAVQPDPAWLRAS